MIYSPKTFAQVIAEKTDRIRAGIKEKLEPITYPSAADDIIITSILHFIKSYPLWYNSLINIIKQTLLETRYLVKYGGERWQTQF